MRRRSKKFLCFLALILFMASYVTSSFIFAYYLRDVYFSNLLSLVTNLVPDDITCYRKNYTVPVNESSTSLEPNSIFFYQTNCMETLSLRGACNIESASIHHKNRKVYVIFVTQPDLTNIVIKELLKLGNVIVTSVDINRKYAEITPFSNTVFLDTVKKERRLYKITADFLKLMTLYQNGGIVIDLDILLAKSLNSLGKNWVIRDKGGFSMAVMKLTDKRLGKAIAGTILFNYKKHAKFGYLNAEKAIEDALEKKCNITMSSISGGTCKGLKIYDKAVFEPISYNQRHLYLQPGYILNPARGYHTWDAAMRTTVPRDSLYARLASTHCPRIFSTFMMTVRYFFRAEMRNVDRPHTRWIDDIKKSSKELLDLSGARPRLMTVTKTNYKGHERTRKKKNILNKQLNCLKYIFDLA